tara:strand:- start:1521 stop:1691 length:171 start_codon:yes stop_codon:yes gene_type:complete
MGDKDIEVELIANNAAVCLSNASLTADVNNLLTETYKIGDLCVYSRKLHVKGGMES